MVSFALQKLGYNLTYVKNKTVEALSEIYTSIFVILFYLFAILKVK